MRTLLLSLVLSVTILGSFIAVTPRGANAQPPSEAPDPTPEGESVRRITAPTNGFYYHGVHPGGTDGWEEDITPSGVAAYENAVWRRVAWVYFSDNWWPNDDPTSAAFPEATANWIRSSGAVPFIRLMIREPKEPGEQLLDQILGRDFDEEFRAWGQAAKDFGSALLVEWGTEMNGDWFPWSGAKNGANQEAADKFAEAYRHIVDTIEAQGADNITWVFHVNSSSAPHPEDGAEWNAIESYYPGDKHVDWVGVSHYGPQSCCETNWDWDEWAMDLKDAVDDLEKAAPGKPVFLLEFGADGNNSSGPAVEGSAVEWANEALARLLDGRAGDLRGFSWWNQRFKDDDCQSHCITDMRVQYVPGLAEAFRRHLAGHPKVIDRPLE